MSGKEAPPPPPISWCRIFRVGLPCAHLCDDCKETFRHQREAEKAGGAS